jgi:hypothetical protein
MAGADAARNRTKGAAAFPPKLLRTVLVRVRFCGVLGVFGGMEMVRMRQMRVMSGLLMVTGFMVLCCFVMVVSGLGMMVRCLPVVMCCFL